MSTITKKKYSVTVDPRLCKACGYCTELCKKQVLKQGDKLNAQGYFYIEAVNSGDCVGCLACVNVCPDFAIVVGSQA